MKVYLITYLLLFVGVYASGQDIPTSQSNSELPKLSTESLSIETEVELYPNPAFDHLNILLKNTRLKNVQFEIYNIIGNKIEFDLDEISNNNYKVDVKDFHSGYYLLIVKDQITRYNKAFKFRIQ